jgi:hypothetical protein
MDGEKLEIFMDGVKVHSVVEDAGIADTKKDMSLLEQIKNPPKPLTVTSMVILMKFVITPEV